MNDIHICIRLIPEVNVLICDIINEVFSSVISVFILAVSKKVISAIVETMIVNKIHSINFVRPTNETPYIIPIIN